MSVLCLCVAFDCAGYNPLVMSKLLLLRDAAIKNPFKTKYQMVRAPARVCACVCVSIARVCACLCARLQVCVHDVARAPLPHAWLDCLAFEQFVCVYVCARVRARSHSPQLSRL